MKKFGLILFLLPNFLLAGTGSTNDVELAYLAIVVALGIIILFLDGIDKLKKNREKIKKFIIHLISLPGKIISMLKKILEMHHLYS